MDDDIDAAIRDIASRHGIAVGRDDPILVLLTINKRLQDDSAQAQQVMLGGYKEELEAIAQRWGHDAKEKAERILTAALAASKEAMAKAMNESALAAAAAVRSEIDSASRKFATAIENAKQVAMMNLIACGFTVAAAALALWAALKS